MRQITDITSEKFNLLSVVRLHKRTNRTYWECECDCGNTTIVEGHKLKSGHTRSCGCIAKAELIARSTKHGMTNSPEYFAWKNLINRCEREKDIRFEKYGKRGIFVCDEWRNDFSAFFRDVGERPSDRHSIDRIDNNDGYHKNNCRWATAHQQTRNRSTNIIVEINGVSMCIHDWFSEYGLGKSSYYRKISKGLSPKEAIESQLAYMSRAARRMAYAA